VLASEQLADVMDLRAGWQVLDVACGSGNATLAAARSGTHAIGVDYVPALLEDGRARAAAEGLDVEFHAAEAENLPFEDSTFDAALTVFGTMFAPDHQRAADEMVRVVRPGGALGLASWQPTGFIGEMFRVITSYVPAPAGVASPMLWGTEEYLDDLFGASVAVAASTERVCTFRFTSPEEFVGFFRRWYGPTLKAFEALDETAKRGLADDLADLAGRWNRHSSGSIAIPSTYLETVLTLN
jgi:ubiquinone/menaquinone biosynthesis C-methylase UbiE